MITHSLFTHLEPDAVSQILGTGFQRFQTDMAIHGLCKSCGRTLEILAIVSEDEGKGNLRRFMELAKAEFTTIKVWDVMSLTLESALKRYGFRPVVELTRFADGATEECNGYRWDKPQL